MPFAPGQQTDLAALKAAFDTNGDGIFSALDDKWGSFGVWQDADSDGITDAGEFSSLDALGINAIGLTSDGQFQVIDGQTVHGTATATKTDGSTLAVADVTLRVKNQTQVTTTHADGSVTTTIVDIPSFAQGQTFAGTADKDLVFGTDGNDHFITGEGGDVIMDDKGDDLIETGAGNDLVYSGQGNDIVSAGGGDDIVFAGAGNDLVFGDDETGSGNDMLMLEDGNDVAFGGTGNDFISGGLGNDVLSGNRGDDNLFGEDGWDALFGQEGNDELYGMDGNDLLDAGDGGDVLDGGAGVDVMQGGAGDDIYGVDNLGDRVDETIDGGVDGSQGHGDAGGNDTVRVSISYTLGSLVENLTLTGTANLNGLGNDMDNVLVGNDGVNTLTAGAGNDVLDGGRSGDTLAGGTGDDTYLVDNGGDLVQEAAGEGVDTVRSRVSYSLAANVENLTLVGINAIDGTGNALDNMLTGNAASNTLSGGAGDDTYVLQRGGGRDTVVDPSGNADSVLVRGNLSAADIRLTRDNLDVIVSINNSNDALVLKNWFSDTQGGASAGAIESIRFESGGTSIDSATIHSLLENHAPVAVADAATPMQEDGIAQVVGNVLANDSDADLPYDNRQHLTVANPGSLSGVYGHLTLSADGGYSYALNQNDSAANVQALGRNTVVTDSFAYTVQDNALDNKTASATLTVTITGGNDGPQAHADAADVAEDTAFTVNGNVLANDTDIDEGDVLAVQAPGIQHGLYGDLTLAADGSYSYALNNSTQDVQSLRGGQQATDSFAYTTTDGLATANSSLTITVTGANDAPEAVADAGVVTEDNVLAATGNVLTNDTDPDAGDSLHVASGTGLLHGTYGDLTLNLDGSYSYALNNGAANSQSLRGGQQVTDVFAYAATDGLATSNSSLTVTVTGANDGPTALADFASVKEDVTLTASGNVLANDTDADQGTVLTVVNAGSLFGQYGSLAMAANGSYVYTLDNNAAAVQRLGAGQSATDVFTYIARDDDVNPLTGTSTLSITVTGANDAPGLASAITTQAAREKQAFAFIVPTGTFTDLDNADALSYTAQAVDAAGNLVALPAWLSFNAVTRTFSGTPGSTAGGSFDFVVTATDLAGAAATSRFTLNISDEFVGTGASANIITGGTADAVLNGTSLNETITGKAGNDTLYGAAGDDVLEGGLGADLLFGDAGNDTLKFSVDATWAIGSQVANVGSPGNAGSNLSFNISGKNRSLDTFDGGAGTDTLLGSNGADAIVLDNGSVAAGIKGIETIDAGAGDDVIDLTSTRFAIGNVTVIGGDGNDVIWTSSGNDILNGGLGDDLLDGGVGVDAMAGGAGNDTYFVDNTADQIVENLNEGVDVVFASASYTLSANVDHLLLLGTNNLNGTGNALANVITGNSGFNTLSGLAGNDTLVGHVGNDLLNGGTGNDSMAGGDGNDTYVIDSSLDQAIEALLGGADLAKSSITYVLPQYIENLQLLGTAATGTGNASANVMAGSDAANSLLGLAGNDALFGGAGADLLDGGAENDLLAGGTGADTLKTGSGKNLVAFNRGDGADTVITSSGAVNTLSLGKGITYASLVLRKTGNDLILDAGAGDMLTFKDWYLSSGNRNTTTLQFFKEGTSDYNPASADKTLNKKVETFNFITLVNAADAARNALPAAQQPLSTWGLSNGLLTAYLSSSDTLAMGGDLAYGYSQTGSHAGIGLMAAQTTLGSSFGVSAQSLQRPLVNAPAVDLMLAA